jgi:hypothetical protein
VRLHVGPLGPEDLLEPIQCKPFDVIDEFAPAVITFSGVALGILVGEARPLRFHHGRAGVILRGDHLQPGLLPAALALDGLKNGRVLLFEGH